MASRHWFAVVLVLLAAGTTGHAQDVADATAVARNAVEQASKTWNEAGPQKTLPVAERAVALAEKSPERATLAKALELLGRSRWGLGEYEAALGIHGRALGIYRELNDAGGESDILIRIGETMYSLGRYPLALENYHLALAANERAAPPSPIRESSIRSNMGVTLRFLGRHEEAAASIERALAIARQLGNDIFVAQALNSLGIINRARGEYQKAIEAYTEAIGLRRKLGDLRGQSQVVGNLGNVYLDLGQLEKAAEAQTTSLALATQAGYTAQIGFSEHNLGTILAELGRPALPHFERALAVWRQIDRQAEIARTLRFIAMQRLLGARDAPGARAALDEALTVARRLRDKDAEGYVLLNLGQLEFADGKSADAVARFSEALVIAKDTGSPDLEFELLAERGRTRLRAGDRDAGIADLQSSVAILNDLRQQVSGDDARISFVDIRQDVFGELAAALADAGRTTAALEAAEGGRARAFADVLHSRQVRAAGERASRFTAESPRIDEIRAIAARLDATLVEYLVTPDRLLIFVVGKDGVVRTASTRVSATQLDGLAKKVVTAFDAADAGALQADSTSRPELAELHRLAVTPIEAQLPADPNARIVVVPHGPLTQIPFAALENPRGEPLVARHTLTFAPSIGVLRYTATNRRTAAPRSSVIFAAPSAPRDAQLPALPGSLEEGRQVAARLKAFAPTLVDGARASERSAKSQLRSAAYIHFATHGLVSDIRPADSSLVLAEGDGEDGYLRAAEIYRLELAADLVVLSGCSTARGRSSGDGVFGLPRAFIYAGAPSVVASLWDISDRATVFLMDRFYEELLRGGDKARALRSAQLATRQRYPHPALWAPFALIGEPR